MALACIVVCGLGLFLALAQALGAASISELKQAFAAGTARDLPVASPPGAA